MKVTEFMKKKTLDRNGMEIGKVNDVDIDPINGKINKVYISKGDLSLKPKIMIIDVDDIEQVGDYVLLSVSGFNETKPDTEKEPEINPTKINIK
jgi:sporulation protein YlmC with PRC-barrel domain